MTSLSRINTFFNFPQTTMPDTPHAKAAVYGVASSCSSAISGAENGAYFLRNMSKAYAWQAHETAIVDLRRHEIDVQSVVDRGDVKGATQEALSKSVQNAVETTLGATVPVFVGGDHSITYEILRAVSAVHERPITLICFDHHLDIQFWRSELDPIFNTNVMSHVENLLGPDRIIHIGVDPYQSIGKERKAEFVSTLKRIGTQISLGSATLDDDQAILDTIGERENIYISVDVDVLHRNEMTATGYPSDQGMSLARVIAIIELIARNYRIVGCDLVEFVADRADRSPSLLADAARATRILLSLLLAISAQSVGVQSERPVVAHPSSTRKLS